MAKGKSTSKKNTSKKSKKDTSKKSKKDTSKKSKKSEKSKKDTSKKSKKDTSEKSKKDTSEKSEKSKKDTSDDNEETNEVEKVVNPGMDIASESKAIYDKLDEMRRWCTQVKHRVKALEKFAAKRHKQLSKVEQKKEERRAKARNKPKMDAGIQKKKLVGEEMATFLKNLPQFSKIEGDIMLSPNDLRTVVNNYAKGNDLKDGAIIKFDDTLTKLFPDVDGNQLAYNKIIGKLGPHLSVPSS